MYEEQIKKKVRGSTASYRSENGPECDLIELAEKYSSVAEVPEHLGFTKAAEIALLARTFLALHKFRESVVGAVRE